MFISIIDAGILHRQKRIELIRTRSSESNIKWKNMKPLCPKSTSNPNDETDNRNEISKNSKIERKK